MPQNVAVTSGQERAVLVNVLRQPDGNTVTIADAVRKIMASLASSYPAATKVRYAYDQADLVRESVGSVREAILIGGVLAAIVLVIFLGNFRSAAVVLTVIPATLLITFALLALLGQTINIMTMGALAIALGLIVDDAIVVVENIFRHMQDGFAPMVAVARGLREIGPAMGASSLCTILTFVPLTLLSGVTGQFFAPLALTIVLALSVSLILSLALAPVLSSSWLKAKARHRQPQGDALEREMEKGPDAGLSKTLSDDASMHAVEDIGPDLEEPQGALMRNITRFYSGVLTALLRRKTLVLVSIVPLLFGVYLLYTRLDTGFMPDMDEGGFVLDYKMPPGTSLAETDRICLRIEEILVATPEVQAYSRRTGAALGFHLTYPHDGDFLVRLKARSNRKRRVNEIMDALRDQIHEEIPGVDVDFAQILQDLIGDLAGAPKPIEVRIFGDDVKVLQELAPKAGKIISGVKGVKDEYDGVAKSGPEVELHVKKELAAAQGMTPEAVSAAANACMYGDVVTSILQHGERNVGVRVWYRSDHEAGLAGIRSLPVVTPTGAAVPLSDLADIRRTEGSTETDRQDLRPMVSITSEISGRDLGSVIRDIKKELKSFPLPPGYSIEYGGLYESQQESFHEMAIIFGIVVVLVFSMLLFYFRSFAEPIALFGAAIASLSGVVLALTITHTPLNIGSITGAVMIIGIVTENGIFLFDYTHQMGRQVTLPLDELLVKAGAIRLRPKIMTILTAILTLFPLALGIGAGAEMQKPLAIAVIGGLSMSTLFTLVLAPMLYSALSRGKYPHQEPDDRDDDARSLAPAVTGL